MRGGFAVELVGDGRALSDLEHWLVVRGYQVTGSTIADSFESDGQALAPVRLIHLSGDDSARQLSAQISAGRSAGIATAASALPGDGCARATALAVGCDDIVEFPGDECLLAHQLDRLYELARTRREVSLRNEAARALMPRQVGPSSRAAVSRLSQAPLRVLLAGPPAQPKVRLAEALGKATISFTDGLESAMRMIDHEPMDLVVLSLQSAEALQSLGKSRMPRRRSAPYAIALMEPSLLKGVDLVEWMQEHQIADVISPTVSVEQLRLRLEHWHQICIGKRNLLEVDRIACLPVDAVTGCVTQDYLTAYLELRRQRNPSDPLALIRFGCANLWQIAGRAGYGMATELLAEMAQITSNAVRLMDLVAYCGNGQVLVSLDVERASDLEGIADRVSEELEAELAGLAGSSPGIITEQTILSSTGCVSSELARFLARPCEVIPEPIRIRPPVFIPEAAVA